MKEENRLDNRFSKNNGIVYIEKDGVQLIQFKNLLKHKNITHCFTTRNGGVSKNEYQSLNLAFNKNDDKKNVYENFKRVSKAVGIDIENMVFSNQVHDNKIKIVNEKDRGKGIIRKVILLALTGLLQMQKKLHWLLFMLIVYQFFYMIL